MHIQALCAIKDLLKPAINDHIFKQCICVLPSQIPLHYTVIHGQFLLKWHQKTGFAECLVLTNSVATF